MAHMRKHQHPRADHNQSIIGAQVGAFAAAAAFCFVDFGHRHGHRYFFSDNGPQKNSGIGLLDIAVNKLHPVKRKGKADRHGCFARAALAAGNRNNHAQPPLPLQEPELLPAWA